MDKTSNIVSKELKDIKLDGLKYLNTRQSPVATL